MASRHIQIIPFLPLIWQPNDVLPPCHPLLISPLVLVPVIETDDLQYPKTTSYK